MRDLVRPLHKQVTKFLVDGNRLSWLWGGCDRANPSDFLFVGGDDEKIVSTRMVSRSVMLVETDVARHLVVWDGDEPFFVQRVDARLRWVETPPDGTLTTREGDPQ